MLILIQVTATPHHTAALPAQTTAHQATAQITTEIETTEIETTETMTATCGIVLRTK